MFMQIEIVKNEVEKLQSRWKINFLRTSVKNTVNLNILYLYRIVLNSFNVSSFKFSINVKIRNPL